MTATQFFNSCHDLVRVRWTLCFGPRKSINVRRIDDIFFGGEEYFNPIVAVALERYGEPIQTMPDEILAGVTLELNPGVFRLVRWATRSVESIDVIETHHRERIVEVREELVNSLTPDETSPLLRVSRGLL